MGRESTIYFMRSILPWYHNQIKTSQGNKSWRIISLMNEDTEILHKILVLQRKNYTTCPCRICSKYVKLMQSYEKSCMITPCKQQQPRDKRGLQSDAEHLWKPTASINYI